MNIEKKMEELTFEQKALLLTQMSVKREELEKADISNIMMHDGPNGIRKDNAITVGGCVCYPTAAALGASWNEQLAYDMGKAMGKACRQEETELLLGPAANMKRSPYCGRNFEYFSEDPVLSGKLGANIINGIESEGVATSLKHFAANNQEYHRTFINAEIDERTLREYYLKVFEIVLKNSNPSSIMCAYNKIGGIWCSENKYLLTDILRNEWGYDGLVISDWGAVHDACKAIRAGLDVDMPCNRNIVNDLKKGLENGEITMEEIDRSVKRVLKFINKVKTEGKGMCEFPREEQHKIAQDIAAECITLLKNEDNVLPITPKKHKKIGVFGPAAERPVFMGGGAASIVLDYDLVDKPIDFLRKYAEDEDIEIYYDPILGNAFQKRQNGFISAEDLANRQLDNAGYFDAMIIFVNDNYGMESETEYWDRDNLTYANYMNGLIERACESCENVILVIQTGSANIPGRWRDKVKGVIQMWYAGEGGGKAIADIIFGYVNPSAKLSESFPLRPRCDMDVSGDGKKTWYKEGPFVGYRYYDQHRDEVWFPFGHGLSYTNFEYSDIKLDNDRTDKKNFSVNASFKVKNVGDMPGKEVVQLYISHKDSTVLKPEKELKAFDKIFLNPGEEKEVTFKLTQEDFQYYNICLKDWHVESGEYKIMIGSSSADIRLSKEYNINYLEDYSVNKIATQYIMQ